MAKNVESIKHKADKRALTPSEEESGYEDSSDIPTIKNRLIK